MNYHEQYNYLIICELWNYIRQILHGDIYIYIYRPPITGKYTLNVYFLYNQTNTPF